MALPLQTVFTKLQTASQYVLNSDYDLLWYGDYAGLLNPYNEYVENLNIPGKTINTNESRTSNSIAAKIAGEVTFEDFEVTWRVTGDFGVYKAINNWMKAVKQLDQGGTVVTGYFSDYCEYQKCKIGLLPPNQFGTSTDGNSSTNAQMQTIVTIDGLYPTALQAIQFSAEGGEYIKVVATFACYKVFDGDI